MNGLVLLGVTAGLLGSAQPSPAQGLAGSPAVSRLGGARSATPSGPGRVKEVTGVLVSDAEGRQMRFETDGRTGYVIPYERIIAMHYEKAAYPRRFLRRSSFYLTVHYSDVGGPPAFETIRLLSERDALSAVATLERDTGGTFDRSAATQSFLGVPIRAGVGARVGVTDQTGQTTKGVMTHVSAVSLTLNESSGVARVFDEASVRKVRLLYSPKHDALVGFGAGAAFGAFGTYLSAGLSGCFSQTSGNTDCHVLRTTAAVAAITGGLGALIGTTIGAIRYPFNNAFDVYRADARHPPGTAAITVAPQITQGRTSVLLSVRF